MLNIAILGSGYVGLSLASHWSKQGHHVSASTRSHSKIKQLKSVCQKVVILHSDDKMAVTEFVKGQDVILVSIAADHKLDYSNAYLKTARILKAILSKLPPKTLIYTSSTLVYGNHEGGWVDENTPLLNATEQGKILIETENVYRSLEKIGWKIVIFRLSEIYGPDRELSKRVKNYQGMSLASIGENYTNMIHLDDIVSAIDYALIHSLQGTFNLTDDEHPTRKNLYDQIANKLDLKKIQFDSKAKTIHSDNKRVSNHKIKTSGYSFIFPARQLD